MKKANLLFILFLIIITLIYLLEILDIGAFIGLITSIVTFYIGYLQQRLHDDKIFKELFENFNKRYDSYNDLINSCSRESSKVLKKKEINKVIDYLNMCAEEYLWYKKGRIPAEVWKAWKKGILFNIKIHQIYKVYSAERKQRESYYGLFEELERKFY